MRRGFGEFLLTVHALVLRERSLDGPQSRSPDASDWHTWAKDEVKPELGDPQSLSTVRTSS